MATSQIHPFSAFRLPDRLFKLFLRAPLIPFKLPASLPATKLLFLFPPSHTASLLPLEIVPVRRVQRHATYSLN